MIYRKRDGTIYRVYPLRRQRKYFGNKKYYDVGDRNKSWIMVDLITWFIFVPLNNTSFITADGKRFITGYFRRG